VENSSTHTGKRHIIFSYTHMAKTKLHLLVMLLLIFNRVDFTK